MIAKVFYGFIGNPLRLFGRDGFGLNQVEDVIRIRNNFRFWAFKNFDPP